MDLSHLNPQQRDAATKIHGSLLILAGAGTGKTSVICHRIAYMLGCGIQPEQVAAMTFTNKAAREMNERIEALVGARAKQLTIGTFHRFCLQILRKYSIAAGLGKRFKLVGTADQLSLVRAALEEMGLGQTYQPETIQYLIGQAKNALIPVEARDTLTRLCINQDPGLADAFSELFSLYERRLRLNHVIDFDDCIYRTVFLLRQHPDIAAAITGRFQYLLVDEFQDTNASQLELLKLLGSHGNVCVVGDDDQSIYSWRGALVETMEKFEAHFKGTKVIKLERNYRCAEGILHAANTVIRNNKARKDKTLWTDTKVDEPIVLKSFQDDNKEALFVAQKIFAGMGKGERPENYGILYRTNQQARNFETALREYQIPYKVYGGTSFFERKEIRDFMAYLRLVLHPGDTMAFWQAINTPPRGIGLKALEEIKAAADERHCSPFKLLGRFPEDIPSRVKAKAMDFHGKVEGLRKTLTPSAASYEACARSIIKTFGFEAHVLKHTKTESSKQKKIDLLRQAPSWIGALAARLEETGSLDPDEFFDLITLEPKDNGDENGDCVSLMSVHAAKGLEFPVVFLTGLEDGTFPHKNSLGTNIDEERRLFYVALTRAKRKLFLTYNRTKNLRGETIALMPSRFLKELPDSIGEMLPKAESEAERNKATFNRLQNLRESLKAGFS